FFTSIVTVKVWPRTTAGGAVIDSTVSAAGATTVAMAEVASAAETAAPVIASVPAAPSFKVNVPVPLAVNGQLKLTVPPGGMLTGPGVNAALAEAVPVSVVAVGTSGDGATALAVVPPLFFTV